MFRRFQIVTTFYFSALNLKPANIGLGSPYRENKFEPCSTKQLWNMFKLWCERGIRHPQISDCGSVVIRLWFPPKAQWQVSMYELYRAHLHWLRKGKWAWRSLFLSETFNFLSTNTDQPTLKRKGLVLNSNAPSPPLKYQLLRGSGYWFRVWNI